MALPYFRFIQFNQYIEIFSRCFQGAANSSWLCSRCY